MARLKVVNYAVNGAGVGHLTRLVAINRWLRRYAQFLGLNLEIYFLTSSEAEGLLLKEQFASFKMPSKTLVDRSGIDKLSYLALAKQWVWHSLGLLRPDLLVVDTFPRGSFGELLSALDLARQRAFVYRPCKDEFAARPEFQSMLPLYDALLVPESSAQAQVRVPEVCQDRLHYFGPVVSRESWELLPREQARRQLGIADDHLALYVSAGGGGDPDAERQLESWIAAARELPWLHLVVAAGPLYTGPPHHGPRLTWLQSWGTSVFLPAIDLALVAAGYNTCNELWQAGVPALYLPQEKVADEQHQRALRAVQCGAGALLEGELAEALEPWRNPEQRQRASQAARQLMPRSHARDCALELLRLLLPAGQVELAQRGLDESVLARCSNFSGLCELLHVWGELPRRGVDRLLELCLELQGQALQCPQLERWAQLWSQKFERFPALARARAFMQLLPSLQGHTHAEAITTFLRLLVREREQPPEEAAASLRRVLERGDEPYALVRRMSELQATQSRWLSNRALLEQL